MSALLDANPGYREVEIIEVDWDKHGRADIVRELNVPRRSTLIAFRGGKEVARVLMRVDEKSIGALFEAALG